MVILIREIDSNQSCNKLHLIFGGFPRKSDGDQDGGGMRLAVTRGKQKKGKTCRTEVSAGAGLHVG